MKSKLIVGKNNQAIASLNNFGLSSDDLIKISKYLKIENLKVLADNEMIRIKKPIGSYIVNWESSFQNGSHWVALHITSNKINYFDSIGFLPDEKLEPYLFKLKRDISMNKNEIQPESSKLCGIYALFFLYKKMVIPELDAEKYGKLLSFMTHDKNADDYILGLLGLQLV